jgi:hypothetical protein
VYNPDIMPRTSQLTLPLLLIFGSLCPQFVLGEGGADLHLETRRLERSQRGCTGDACTKVVLVYPEVTGDSPAAEAVRRWVAARILADPWGTDEAGPAADGESLARMFLEENRAFQEEVPDALGIWALEREITVLHRTPRVLSLALEEYSYQGGAHPVTWQILGSFDLKTGKELILADLFQPGFEAPVIALVEAELRRGLQLGPDEDLNEVGFFLEDGLPLPDNFALVAEGLRLFYNVYDIAPYVMGPTDLILPYEDLAPWARPGGLLEPADFQP